MPTNDELDSLDPEIEASIHRLMQRGKVPGLSIAMVDRDALLFAGGLGRADVSRNVTPTAATQYLWFSMSKIVTATAAMVLADDGRLDLDAPASEYVPYLNHRTPQPSTRQLLSHTSGLGNPIPIRWAHLTGAAAPDPAALLRRKVNGRRAYRGPVGGQARYSNIGYLAVGEVIRATAGKPFVQHVGDSVLEPAAMLRTGYAYQPDAEAAIGYVRAPRLAGPALRALLPSGIVGHRDGPYFALNPFYVDGPAYGGLVGDVLDVGRFLRLHLNDGVLDGRRVLSAASTRDMRRLDQPGKPFDHGIGWFRRPTPGRGDWVEHFGAGAGFWNVMRLYPERGIGIVIMSNNTTTYDFDPLFEQLATPYK
jgi:CubicO group peptidase (beta-lactamase class C family)